MTVPQVYPDSRHGSGFSQIPSPANSHSENPRTHTQSTINQPSASPARLCDPCKRKLSVEILQVLERITQLIAGHTQDSSAESDLARNFWSACPSLTVSISNEEPDIDNLLALGLWLYVALEFSSRSVAESVLIWISMSRSTRQDLSTRLIRCVHQGIRTRMNV